jgi:hypothetical protein
MATRTAILKGYTLFVRYTDGSMSKEEFEPDELGTMEDQITNLFLTMDSVDCFRVGKVWSEPGETVSLKIKQNGE